MLLPSVQVKTKTVLLLNCNFCNAAMVFDFAPGLCSIFPFTCSASSELALRSRLKKKVFFFFNCIYLFIILSNVCCPVRMAELVC